MTGVPLLASRVACVSLSLFGLLFALVTWFLDYMPVVQVIPMERGYSLTVYQDWDVDGHELNYSLQRMWISSPKRYFAEILGEKHPVPHLTAHVTPDGGAEWVSADTKPNEVIFLLDLSSGQYWPNWDGSLRWPDDENYIARIDADGVSRTFNEGGRLDE